MLKRAIDRVPNKFAQKLTAFADLTPDDIIALESATALSRRVPANTNLIHEGDRPTNVFVVLEGWACRYKILPEGSRQIMAFLMPGDCCDMHITVLAEMDHSIGTLTPSRIATITNTEMADLTRSRPQIMRALRSAQLVDEGTLRAWIVSMGRRGSVQRVAHLICELYLRARNIGLAADDAMDMPLSQIVLADALGLTPVHINRVFRDLRLANVMTIRRGGIMIADPAGLARIAGFDENYLHRRLRVPV